MNNDLILVILRHEKIKIPYPNWGKHRLVLIRELRCDYHFEMKEIKSYSNDQKYKSQSTFLFFAIYFVCTHKKYFKAS